MARFGEYTVDITEEQAVMGYTTRTLSLFNTEVHSISITDQSCFNAHV